MIASTEEEEKNPESVFLIYKHAFFDQIGDRYNLCGCARESTAFDDTISMIQKMKSSSEFRSGDPVSERGASAEGL